MILIKNAKIVNENNIFLGHLLIKDHYIHKIFTEHEDLDHIPNISTTINAQGLYLLPGVIDDQVHFREPGLTHKGDIFSESKAAVAGGITSYMEMPNTIPNVFTQELLEDKYTLAIEKSWVNYSFYMGASNDNLNEVLKTDPEHVCGVKIFMGSSTGNMLVDNRETLKNLFSECKLLIATHCEDETTIQQNLKLYQLQYGENMPMHYHPHIRSEEACYKSSSLAVELAHKYNTRLHVLHISTQKELSLFNNTIPLKDKRVTSEACIHHLWFSDKDYEQKGSLIKWNPAIKKESDKEAILEAVLNNTIDVIATDHAPHTLEEKKQSYFKSPSGGPLVQHALVAMLELYHQKKISLEKIAEKMSHAVANCFQIEKRGYIREGYFADLVLVDLQNPWKVNTSNILYKCGWSPFEETVFQSKITHTFVNGNLIFENGKFYEKKSAQRLRFNR